MLDPRAVAEARDLWTGDVPVRTMPFRRAEADPAAPLLVTFGTAEGTVPCDPPEGACRGLAGALQQARARPLHLMVRLDVGETIVRGDVRSDRAEQIAAALATVSALARLATQAVHEDLPEDTHLITATYSTQADRWMLQTAHGFREGAWRRRFDAATGWVEVAKG